MYALIAGGSRGIGFAIAEALAKRGYDLILIARGQVDLERAKDKLQTNYKTVVHTLSYDLSLPESAPAIRDWCLDHNIPINVLGNIVGLGGANDFLDLPIGELWYMTRLNTGSCMAMTALLLPLLEKNRPAYILNVASMAGFAPIPIKNLYSATKSSVICFSYALRYQLKTRRVSVSCLAPGPVLTKPEIAEETKRRLGKFGVLMEMKPEKVGEIAVRRMFAGRLLIVPGFFAKMTSIILRLLPKRIITAIYYKLSG